MHSLQTTVLDPPDPIACARQLGEASVEPVIFLGADRIPCWANDAARALGGIAGDHESGASLDDDLGRFEIRFAAAGQAGDIEGRAVARTACGHAGPSKQAFRLRETALKAGERIVGYVVALSPLEGVGDTARLVRAPWRLGIQAAALIRASDRMVIETNEAFCKLTGRCGGDAGAGSAAASGIPAALLAGPDTVCFPTLGRLETASGEPTETVLVDCQTEVLDGEEFRLLTFTRLDPDLTASVLAHSLLEDSSAVSQLICSTVAAPVFVLDAERCVVSASEELLRLLCYNASDFVGRPIVEFLGASSIRPFKDAFWTSLGDCSLAEDPACELVTSHGRSLRVRLTGRAVLDRNQVVRRVTCVVEDLTERDVIETKFSTLFALSPIPMAVRRLDDTRILDVNPAFLSMTGYTAEAVVGRPMDELAVFEPGHLRQRFERELRAGLPLRAAEMRIKAQDGSLLEVKATAAAVQAFGDRCALVILHDAAQGRFDEQQLFKAIETVMSDTSWFSREVVEKLAAVRMPRGPSVRHGELDDLTKREREVLAMISHGWSDAEIASRLSLTRSTVRNHVAALYSKIGVHSRSSAIVWARERALNVIHPASGFGQVSARRATPANPDARCRHG